MATQCPNTVYLDSTYVVVCGLIHIVVHEKTDFHERFMVEL